MRVFLIGGTGYIGRAVTAVLAEHGHTPVVLARSAQSRSKVVEPRAEIVDGSIADLDVLLREVAKADAVIYLAVAGMQGATSDDDAAIDAILGAYEGTGKSFILTSGLAVYLGVDTPIVTSTTDTSKTSPSQSWRVSLEHRVLSAARQGIRTLVVRPPIVYGRGGASAVLLGYLDYVAAGNPAFFVGDGDNRIPTVHVDDLARAYDLALAAAPAGSSYNVASGSILGYDLAKLAAVRAGSTAEPKGVSFSEGQSAIGPAVGALAMNLNISEWQLVTVLGWYGGEPTLALTLAQGGLPGTVSV